MCWEELTHSYNESGIVLALGAGVSVGVRPSTALPNWAELLDRLTSELTDSGVQLPNYRELVRHGLTLPVVASIVEEFSPDREKFVERVRSALYRHFPFAGGVWKTNRRDFVQYVRESNPTLHSVASLCAVSTGEGRYNPNPKIRGIVNFNLDALLQAYVYSRFAKPLLRTIERASASSSANRINVYHVHGFLRFDEKAGDPTKEAGDAVVFTEQDYYDFFNDQTGLFTYTMFYLLREATFLFIGLSMQDENIRRMLHISKKERVQAFKKEKEAPKRIREKTSRHFAILRHSEKPRLDEAIERSLLPLGTRVLWVDDWDEIPKRVRALYESTGDHWDAVS
jgi:hypothetical protein